MTEPPAAVRASDADRDAAAEALAEAVASGRLSLAEHSNRLDAMYAAATASQVQAVVADLPSLPAKRSGMYRAVDPHKVMVIGGQAQRAGRFRIGRFCSITALFGRVDMDLRNVLLSHDPDQVTIIVRSLASTVSIIVPKGWRIQEQVFVLGSKQAIDSRDDNSRAVMFRVRGTMLGGTFTLIDG
ncbi:MAG TPA: DUF1707 domain-containing protein [Streptosporangiaceae bacterium]|nr:DUF1707 domain-containing protein [Streptosporangiaceae bacterium]